MHATGAEVILEQVGLQHEHCLSGSSARKPKSRSVGAEIPRARALQRHNPHIEHDACRKCAKDLALREADRSCTGEARDTGPFCWGKAVQVCWSVLRAGGRVRVWCPYLDPVMLLASLALSLQHRTCAGCRLCMHQAHRRETRAQTLHRLAVIAIVNLA